MRPRAQTRSVLLTVGPAIGWIGLFLVIPGVVLLLYSFLSIDDIGRVVPPLTLENYGRLIAWGPLGINFVYWEILGRSLWVALVTTVLCVLLAFPVAFFIAAQRPSARPLWLTLLVIPFWTNLVIRAYAWMFLLAPSSPITQAAAALGLVERGAALYPSDFAVYIGMVSTFLPFMALPLYTAVERIDWSLAEAAADLYAGRWQAFWAAVFPQTVPGLVAGVILVTIPATGMFVVSDLLGGGKTMLLGNVIQQEFGTSNDYPFGAALSFLVMGLTLLGLGLYARIAGRRALSGVGDLL
ncbi:spermidine/putrescine transport system permease protein [Deinobacterium chartae]|uniref:Spermidine/putrescine transport system permease protein n=1 Tax=Deinobacterium chartae TaxID=521158 RepID=A0A841HYU3_9DEIO|nr:spermidine/putrescine transport system permease protein [Deinobacterium chartae]